MEEILAEFKKKYGDGSIMFLNDVHYSAHDLGFISTGSFTIDYAMRCPGIPLGRVIEIAGFESVGKSSLGAAILGSFQRAGGVAILVDTEHSYAPDWAVRFGVNPEKLLLVQPDTLEQAAEQMIFLAQQVRAIQKDQPVVILHDSVAATPTSAEVDGDFGDHSVGLHARILSKALRMLTNIIWDNKIALVFINQLKERPMAWGAKTGKIGGHAIPYHAAVMLEIKKKLVLPESKGIRCEVTTIKNKLAAPFRAAEFEIDFETGIRDDITISSLAVELGFANKKGAGWYELPGKDKSVRVGELADATRRDVFDAVFGTDYDPGTQIEKAEEPAVVGESSVKVFKVAVPESAEE